ncbi:YrdB family protein [Nocardia uniformis]|nr:YrdB family protein [Nocardia uniformis]
MSIAKGANLLLMFVLELAVLATAAAWGYSLDAPPIVRILAAVAATAVFIVVWKLFGAARDARYKLTGLSRAALEVLWFGGGAVLLGFTWSPTAGVVLFALWVINGVLRVLWDQVDTVAAVHKR